MRTLIIPCAGQSSRFNTTLPKWLLKHPSGKTMVYEAIQGLPLSTFDEVIIVALKKHLTNDLVQNLYQEFNDYNFTLLLLDKDTSSASDTVSQCIELLEIEGGIFIKDSDDYFKIDKIDVNQICTFPIQDGDGIIAENKSYIKEDENGWVTDIAEKEVISSNFCCGLYSFADAKEFVEYFRSMESEEEIYISHVIDEMIYDSIIFTNKKSTNYIDWGTQADWDKFKKNYE